MIQAFPVFTFSGTTDSLAIPSFASLDVEVDLPDNFILCSSSKQARFDEVGFFSIAGKDLSEWLRVDFRTYSQATRLAIFWGEKYHRLGELQNPRLEYWYHICLRLDITKSEIEVGVNGELLGSVLDKNLTNIPNKLDMKIGVGYDNIHHQDSVQFQGSVGNVRILKEGNVTDISTVPCNLRQSTILPWNRSSWKVVGSDWSLIEESDDIFCVSSEHYNLAIPAMITIMESMDICRAMLNKSVIPFQQDPEAFLRYVAWHKKTSGGRCPRIWTPLSDQTQEGLFLNMNNNATVEPQAWDRGEPNGGEEENFVMIDVSGAALNDVAQTRLSCSSCRLTSSLLLTLDGLCKDSMIGVVLKFDKKYI